MNTETLEALNKSIAHWERMRDDPDCGEEPYTNDCALCQLFFYDRGADQCKGCPVMIVTGQTLCQGSPYIAAERAWRRRSKFPTVWHTAATRQIEFLKLLRPIQTMNTDKESANISISEILNAERKDYIAMIEEHPKLVEKLQAYENLIAKLSDLITSLQQEL